MELEEWYMNCSVICTQKGIMIPDIDAKNTLRALQYSH